MERLFSPGVGLYLFAGLLLLVYAVVPTIAYFTLAENEALLQLALICVIAVAAMLVGARIPLFDARFRPEAQRIAIPEDQFILGTWVAMVVFVVVTFATAPTIPILSALSGAGADLSQERGEFLKGRQGAGAVLIYISTFLTNTVVPYSIIVLYAAKSRWRHVAGLLFFCFCISFLQKALFLNLVLPMLAFMALAGRLKGKSFLSIIGACAGLLIVTTALSVATEASDTAAISGDYLSALYVPTGPLDYFLWRTFAVPIFTAVDTLIVHAEQFGGRPLLGATSSLLASITGVERINLERFVFEHQFGSWNDIANSNAVFITDAFVNFGQIGVVLFGLAVGVVFRCFEKSKDIAFKCMWPLFAFVLFSSPLIGMMFSNGFLYMLIHALFIRLSARPKPQVIS